MEHKHIVSNLLLKTKINNGDQSRNRTLKPIQLFGSILKMKQE